MFFVERESVRDNKSLRLDEILPAPRGVPLIEDRFVIDADGILSVTAVDKATGREQRIAITGALYLVMRWKEWVMKPIEEFAKEDKEKSDVVDLKNRSDSVI